MEKLKRTIQTSTVQSYDVLSDSCLMSSVTVLGGCVSVEEVMVGSLRKLISNFSQDTLEHFHLC